MNLHSIIYIFFIIFFFLLYKYDSRRMELSSIHEVIRPSSSLLEFSTLFRNLDPVCLWSLYMFDVRQLFFFFSLSFFYSWLLCNVVTLVLGAPRSKKCIIPPNRTGNKSSKAIDDEEPRKVGGNRVPGLRFFSSGSMLVFKRNSRFWGGNYGVGGGMCDSDPAILDFQVHRDGITIKCLRSVDFWIKITLQFAY